MRKFIINLYVNNIIKMVELKKVTSDNIYDTIHNFVTSGELVVDNYDSMIEVILSMIKGGYCFAMDRDLLRDAMESLTYMYAPSDDMNKDRLVQQFADDEEDACFLVQEILSYLPDHNDAEPPHVATEDPITRLNEELETLVPDNPNRPYDMVKVVEEVVDDGEFLELFTNYAENIIIGFARLNGRTIGVVGNQPNVLAGCLDIDASIKAARFIRLCDAFNIPLVTFEDVPGFLPGVVQEWGGIIRHGAKLLFAYAEATVPKLTLVTRKAYGGAYLAMSCKHLQSDYNVAWPTAELAVMGAEGAVNIIHRREINAVEPEQQEEVRLRLVDEYKAKFGDPYVAARNGWLDDVIEPSESRLRLCRALNILRSKREWSPPKKHGNIPL